MTIATQEAVQQCTAPAASEPMNAQDQATIEQDESK